MTGTQEVQAETKNFQAEIQQLLHLLTHSLYSHPEIFIRELISNASDALDKLRFMALTDAALLKDDPELGIHIKLDSEKKTFTITDNGIGMNREEIEENIGTIARSGSKSFLQKLSGDENKDLSLIGQFGVGFYSIFMVADKVTLVTRKADSDDGWTWESDGKGTYTLTPTRKVTRGTEITLHMAEGQEEYLEDWQVRSIIRKFSDYVSYDIRMPSMDTRSEEEREKDVKEGKVFKQEPEIINEGKAIWSRPKNEIKDEDYTSFYKHIAHDHEAPLTWSHFTQEGTVTFTSIIYIPKHAPFDLLTQVEPKGLKLYVRRVFIMDECKEMLPRYLRFVQGIVDTEDLPLNVSREILQQNKTIQVIKKNLVKKILDTLKQIAQKEPKQYSAFWQEMGGVLKEGFHFDIENKDRLADLIRFRSSKAGKDEWVSLQDYKKRMAADQKSIFFITAESSAAAEASPHLEVFRKKDIEVLYLVDAVDEWVVPHLTEYQETPLVSVTKGELDLGELGKEEKIAADKASEEIKGVADTFRKILQEKVKTVRTTTRLTDSPCCLVADQNEMSANLERILAMSQQGDFKNKKILEINPSHPAIQKLNQMIGDKNQEDALNDWVLLFFDQALLAEGSKVDDPKAFNDRLNKLILQSTHS